MSNELSELLAKIEKRRYTVNNERRLVAKLRGPIKKRLEEAFGNKKTMRYNELLNLVYPDFWSHKRSMNGGPPGCVFAFVTALRRYGYVNHSGVVTRPVRK